MRVLREEIWPKDRRITVGALVGNEAAQAFYEAAGFRPYSIELEIPAQEGDTQQRFQADPQTPPTQTGG